MLSFENAIEIFLDRFLQVHPKDSWPSWFKSCTSYSGTVDAEGHWRLAFTAMPKECLGENESWEIDEKGHYVLTKVDPDSGEKWFVISNTAEKVITLFEVKIDKESNEIEILSDQDLHSINGAELFNLR